MCSLPLAPNILNFLHRIFGDKVDKFLLFLSYVVFCLINLKFLLSFFCLNCGYWYHLNMVFLYVYMAFDYGMMLSDDKNQTDSH